MPMYVKSKFKGGFNWENNSISEVRRYNRMLWNPLDRVADRKTGNLEEEEDWSMWAWNISERYGGDESEEEINKLRVMVDRKPVELWYFL